MFNQIYKDESLFIDSLVKIEQNTKRARIPLKKRGTLHLVGDSLYIKNENAMYECLPRCVDTILERAGISGPCIERFTKEELVKVLKLCLSKLGSEKGLLVTIDEKACALLSDNYKVIGLDEIFKEASSEMSKLNGKFGGGFSTINETTASYTIDNPELRMEYSKKFENSMLEKAVPVLEITSSNTGLSSVSLVPKFFVKGHEIVIGKPLKAAHKGSSDMKTVKDNLSQTFAIFKAATEKLSKLRDVKIQYPMQCFKNVAKRINLSKKLALLAAGDFMGYVCEDEEITAYDIYLGLTEAIFHAEMLGKKKEIINSLQEIVARAIYLDYSEFDIPVSEW